MQIASNANEIVLTGTLGQSGSRRVLMGFAPASLLHSISFADVLDEQTGKGYQRQFSQQHSHDFRRYILLPGSATIPLTFNLRPELAHQWRLVEQEQVVNLIIQKGHGPVLAQVDCQHRLGCVADLDVPLPFMTFIGMSLREEMQIFNIINGKAKGLSGSLLDYHEAILAKDVAKEKPQLYIALRLHQDPESPWFSQLELGGKKSSGLTRRASLRTLQKAIKTFLNTSHILDHVNPGEAYATILAFWRAVAGTLPMQWENTRQHYLTKGIGVYALMLVAADLWTEKWREGRVPDEQLFREELSQFINRVNWSNKGDLKGFGGQGGVQETYRFLKQIRKQNPVHNA